LLLRLSFLLQLYYYLPRAAHLHFLLSLFTCISIDNGFLESNPEEQLINTRPETLIAAKQGIKV